MWKDGELDLSLSMKDLSTYLGKFGATGTRAQTPIDMVEDLNVENENDHIPDVRSPLSINWDSKLSTSS